MLVNQSKIKIAVTDLIMILISVCYLLGIHKWFSVCPVMGESVMACHWAGEVLKAIALLVLIISVVHTCLPDEKIKIGVDIALVGLYIMTIFVPGRIVHICSDSMMHCRKATQPWTIVFCIVLLLVALADIVFYCSKLAKDRHTREQ